MVGLRYLVALLNRAAAAVATTGSTGTLETEEVLVAPVVIVTFRGSWCW